MSRYGSAQLNLFLVDGFSLLAIKAKDLATEIEAVQEDTTGIGDDWPEFTPTGRLMAGLAQGEAFYDEATDGAHDLFIASPSTSRIVTYGFEGDTLGQSFIGHAGAFGAKYKVMAKNGNLTKAQTEYTVSGARDEGVILQPTAAQTEDWDGTAVDNGASSSNGGVAYLHVTALSGITGFIGKVQDSADGENWTDLVTFDDVDEAPAAQRIAVAGTVDQHLRFVGDVTGTGSITVFAGFARN